MFSNKLNYKVINLTALMLLFYIGFSNIKMGIHILKIVITIVFPFIISFACSYSLYPMVKLLINKGIKKKLAIAIIIIGFTLMFLALIVVTLPLIYEQFVLFSKYILSVIDHVGVKFHLNLGGFELKLTDYLNTTIKYLSNIVSDGAFGFVDKSIDFTGSFVVGYISGVYFLYDMENIREKIKITTEKISKKFYQYMKCLDREIGNYVKGLFIVMFVQLIEYSFLFFIVGHPNWLLLGILASITTVIPYFGGLVTNIIGVAIATTISSKVLIGTIIVCILAPIIDSYLISPKIYGKTNHINPLITIMIVFIGGSIFGISGIIASIPCYLLLRTTYIFFHKKITKEVKKITTSV